MKKIIDKLVVKYLNNITIGFVIYSKTNKGWNCGTNVFYTNKTMCRLLEDFKLYKMSYK